MSSSPPSSYNGNPEMAKALGMKIPCPSAVDMQEFCGVELQQPHRYQDIMKTGKPLFGALSILGALETVEVMSKMGFDFIFVDLEHTPMSSKEMRQQVRMIHHYSEGRTAAMVRVPSHHHEWVTWALDAGAAAVLFIDTKEQAEAAVRHSKYPPLGTRGFPPSNLIHGVTDGVIPRRKNIRDSNDQNSAVFFMIESKEGVENVEDIVAVAGIDYDETIPILSAAIDRVIEAAKRNNVPVMMAVSASKLTERLKQGVRLVVTCSERHAMSITLSNVLAEARATAGKAGLGENNGACKN